MAEPGWYPDPQQPGVEAWFDGTAWTGHQRPAESPAAAFGSSGSTQPQPAVNEQGYPQAQPFEQTSEYRQPYEQPQPYGQAPSEQTQAYGQAPYGQAPYGQASPGPAPYGADPAAEYQGYGQPPAWGTPPAAPARSRKRVLIAAVVAVVLVGGGLTTWLVWPSDSGPSITYDGRAVKDVGDVLTSAEADVTKSVKSRHGATDDLHCYFTQASSPSKSAKKTDVGDDLFCGPVLFVDSDVKKQYVDLALNPGLEKGKSTLTPATLGSTAETVSAPTGDKLVRPDGVKAPTGAGGLKAPTPPAAEANALLATSLGPITDPGDLSNARMVSQSTGLQITSAGTVQRYGAGDDARTAPKGQKLIAFQTITIDGDLNDDGSAQPQLVVSGSSTKRDLPEADSGQWIVAAIPSASTATVELASDGVTQTLSLPDGRPGTGNLTVLSRENRDTDIRRSAKVTFRATGAGGSVNDTVTATAAAASLDYWVPSNPKIHGSKPNRAILVIDVYYREAGETAEYGFETVQEQLKLPDGTVIKARNAATSAKKLLNVFDVPANITTATLIISGTSTQDGYRLSVTKAVSFPISFPAN